MASSSKQESKLPGRMGLCRLNSHLSGSLLVFRRKMSPVKRKKPTTKQETHSMDGREIIREKWIRSLKKGVMRIKQELCTKSKKKDNKVKIKGVSKEMIEEMRREETKKRVKTCPTKRKPKTLPVRQQTCGASYGLYRIEFPKKNPVSVSKSSLSQNGETENEYIKGPAVQRVHPYVTEAAHMHYVALTDSQALTVPLGALHQNQLMVVLLVTWA